MANPLLSRNAGKTNQNTIKQRAENLKRSGTPDELKNNPAIQSVLALFGGDPKRAFYALCKQKGIDPESILSQLRN